MVNRSHTLIVVFIIALGSFFSFLNAQQQHHLHLKRIENTAYESFRIEEYEEALKDFLILDSITPGNSDYNWHIGLSYYFVSEPNLSLKYLIKAKQKGHKGAMLHDIDYYLGRDFHLCFYFDSAKVYYEKYLSKITKERKTPENTKRISEINRFMENCTAGKQIMSDTVPIVIENLGSVINSSAGDYAPNLSADESMMIFTSRRDNGLDEEYAPDGKPHEDIYISVKDDKGNWGAPLHMGDSINTPGHDACVGLSADGHKLYIYRSWERKSVSGDIYVSELKGNKWQSLYRFTTGKINSRQYWEASLNFSSDGKWMFFTSDRAGGYGASDIYYSRKNDEGVWSEPKNLGPVINTIYAEDAPVLHSDGKTLFFSSKGHSTMGGFDIFSSDYDEKTDSWSPPKNMGYPINTPDNDLYFSYTADGSKAYFSSKRPGGYGDKDIYVLHRPGDSPAMVVLKGRIKEQGSDDPIPATITVTNSETHAVENVFSTNPETGKYVVVLGFGKTYEIKIESKGHMYKSETITIPDKKADVFQHVQDFFIDIVENHPEPEKAKIEKKPVTVNVPKTSGFLKGTDIEYVQAFYEKKHVDSAAITIYPRTPDPQKSVQHNITYAEAFFDSVSSNVYTMHISLAKLESGKKFVLYDIFFDFNKYDLKEESLPELETLRNLMLENTQLKLEVSGHTDNKGKDAYNMTLSQNRAKSVVNYLVGKGISKSRLIALGYGETTPVADNSSKYGRHLNRRIEFQILDTLKRNTESSVDYLKLLPMKVHFEKNVSKKITKFSKQRLDELAHFINHNPDLKIGIVAYQDSTTENNKSLIGERANTAKDYLISNGISEDNLMIIEPDKINQEPNQNPGEMRKVEFYILN